MTSTSPAASVMAPSISDVGDVACKMYWTARIPKCHSQIYSLISTSLSSSSFWARWGLFGAAESGSIRLAMLFLAYGADDVESALLRAIRYNQAHMIPLLCHLLVSLENAMEVAVAFQRTKIMYMLLGILKEWSRTKDPKHCQRFPFIEQGLHFYGGAMGAMYAHRHDQATVFFKRIADLEMREEAMLHGLVIASRTNDAKGTKLLLNAPYMPRHWFLSPSEKTEERLWFPFYKAATYGSYPVLDVLFHELVRAGVGPDVMGVFWAGVCAGAIKHAQEETLFRVLEWTSERFGVLPATRTALLHGHWNHLDRLLEGVEDPEKALRRAREKNASLLIQLWEARGVH